jgi:hypothetical protein
MELDRQGRIQLESGCFPLGSVADILADVAAGRILGRAALVP